MRTKFLSVLFIQFVVLSIFAIANVPQKKEIWMNIFVHGTVGFQSTFSLTNFFLLLHDTIVGTPYEKSIQTIRQNPILSTIQPIQQLGLVRINQRSSIMLAPSLFASLYDKIDQMTLPHIQKSKLNLFYTFGWSGALSYSQRFFDAKLFYLALRLELKRLYKKNIYPKIRVIGYSHGGNIALNLAAIRAFEFSHDKFSINELVLLGMPIQFSAQQLIWSPMFEKIYHIYSEGDRVQRADIFNPMRAFSLKRFSGNLPDHLTQIELMLTAKPLPLCQNQVYSRRFSKAICQSPGHIELWFFGWTSRNYRKRFTLYPLPTGVFIPYLTKISDYFLPCSRHITINIYPDNGVSIIKHRCETKELSVPFFNPLTLARFKDQAMNCVQDKNMWSKYNK